jgi:general secretion pathway protein D
MSTSIQTRRSLAVLLAVAMTLILPVSVAASGKKHFKEGMKYELNRQWDKAARSYALALAESPSNIEYQLHYQKALVNAGIMLVDQGDMLAGQNDYNAAYQSYRQAFAFDPTNELAVVKMRQMLRLQGKPETDLPGQTNTTGASKRKRASIFQTGYSTTAGTNGTAAASAQTAARIPAWKLPQRILYRPGTPIQTAIENLANAMNLNVMFDSQAANMMLSNRNFSLHLNDVTPVRALEMILQANGLMYSQFDRRTIIIAADTIQNRGKYEQLAIRTFYLKNADPAEVQKIISGTLTNTKQIVVAKQLNALIVRDTPANLETIESLIDSVDKSKAEVLVDINIYEVTRGDLLELGNQFAVDPGKPFGSTSNDNNNGDNGNNTSSDFRVTPGAKALGGIGQVAGLVTQNTRLLTGFWGLALGIPASNISFFQNNEKAKLLASTQVHVVDQEAHTIRIGQRVPIRTATLPSLGTTPTTPGQQPISNIGGFGVEQIQYENVGLNIDMTPTVFDDEVQIKMKIESSSVSGSGGASLTPTFSQRQLSSLARIKDGHTTMIAGVSQTQQDRGFRGIPLIGLVPILGRMFSIPTNNDRQSDVVITVTPHILRRADITDEDHIAFDAGTGLNSTRTVTIEQILFMADHEDAQKAPVTASVPAAADKPQPDKLLASTPDAQIRPVSGPGSLTAPPGVVVSPPAGSSGFAGRGGTGSGGGPAPDVQRRTVPAPGAQVPPEDDEDDADDDEVDSDLPNGPIVVTILGSTPVAVKGTQFFAVVTLRGAAQISYANLALTYDPTIFEVKAVRSTGLMNQGGVNVEPQFTAQGGLLNVIMERPPGSGGVQARGQLVFVIFDVKGQGQTSLALGEHSVFRMANGQTVPARFIAAQIDAK